MPELQRTQTHGVDGHKVLEGADLGMGIAPLFM